MSGTSPSERSRLWSETGEPPNWLLVGSLLTGVIAVALVAVQLYLNRLGQREDPSAGGPVAPARQLAAVQSGQVAPVPVSPTSSTASSDPSTSPPIEASPSNSPSSAPSSPPGDATIPSLTQVTAARVGTGSSDPPPRPEVKDPWPDLEVSLGATPASANELFRRYAASDPPRNAGRRPLSLCVIGDLSQTEERLLLIVREFLGITFDAPVQVQRRIPTADIPVEFRRFNERFNDLQLDSTGLLGEVLAPRLPAEAHAIVGLTTADLFPLPTPELLEWQGASRSHVSLFVLPRHPDGPIAAADARRIVLRGLAEGFRGIAPLYGLGACTDDGCVQHAADVSSDPPALLCPACLHALCWNLDVEPEALLRSQHRFFAKYGLRDQATACQASLRRLAGSNPHEPSLP